MFYLRMMKKITPAMDAPPAEDEGFTDDIRMNMPKDTWKKNI